MEKTDQSDIEKVAANNKLVDQLKERNENIRIQNDTIEEEFSCDKCVCVSKSKAGVKIHESKKHKGNV